jgi:DMSO/TMAO reductase YedYZ molybdopterin-dependent catalytic subunit
MSILDTEWEGIRTEELKKIVEIKDSARFVIVHCAEGYTTMEIHGKKSASTVKNVRLYEFVTQQITKNGTNHISYRKAAAEGTYHASKKSA